MFTGIIASRGTLQKKTLIGGDMRLVFDCGELSLDGARPGDSICVSGVCLTMLEPDGRNFAADASPETLELTTLGSLEAGQAVNLELALGAGDRMGGHLVTGHVDGLARLVARQPDARAERLEFEVPPELERYVARKGSVCLDGVSLTVNTTSGTRFSVCLIPHTLAVTTLGDLKPGDPVNLEVDVVARYLERLSEYATETSEPREIPGKN